MAQLLVVKIWPSLLHYALHCHVFIETLFNVSGSPGSHPISVGVGKLPETGSPFQAQILYSPPVPLVLRSNAPQLVSFLQCPLFPMGWNPKSLAPKQMLLQIRSGKFPVIQYCQCFPKSQKVSGRFLWACGKVVLIDIKSSF